MTEQIVAVAILSDHDGIKYTMRCPSRHHHIIHELAQRGFPLPITGDQGFMTDTGRFLDREEAAKFALSNGQCKVLTAPPNLFSEDLW